MLDNNEAAEAVSKVVAATDIEMRRVVATHINGGCAIYIQGETKKDASEVFVCASFDSAADKAIAFLKGKLPDSDVKTRKMNRVERRRLHAQIKSEQKKRQA